MSGRPDLLSSLKIFVKRQHEVFHESRGGTRMATNRARKDLENTIKHWRYIANDIHEPMKMNPQLNSWIYFVTLQNFSTILFK